MLYDTIIIPILPRTRDSHLPKLFTILDFVGNDEGKLPPRNSDLLQKVPKLIVSHLDKEFPPLMESEGSYR
jgi:hypothetical protein